MATTFRFAAPALIVLLAACGEWPADLNFADGSADATMQDGTAFATDTTGKGLAPPANLPDFAPIYPGGTVQQVVVNDRSPAKPLHYALAKAQTPMPMPRQTGGCREQA